MWISESLALYQDNNSMLWSSVDTSQGYGKVKLTIIGYLKLKILDSHRLSLSMRAQGVFYITLSRIILFRNTNLLEKEVVREPKINVGEKGRERWNIFEL